MKEPITKGSLELKRLPNGTIILPENSIVLIHNLIIEDRKLLGKEDPISIRNIGPVQHLYHTLLDRPQKYTEDKIQNALYVATETFYYIACEHPFTEGNKSTAYVCSLFLLTVNLSENREFILSSAPKEAEEIVKLAEGGKEPSEIKKLIKEFLQKEIRA